MPFDWTQLIAPAITGAFTWAVAYTTAKGQADKTVREIQHKQYIEFKAMRETEAYNVIKQSAEYLIGNLRTMIEGRKSYTLEHLLNPSYMAFSPVKSYNEAWNAFRQWNNKAEIYYPAPLSKASEEIIKSFPVALSIVNRVVFRLERLPVDRESVEKIYAELPEENLQQCLDSAERFKTALANYMSGEDNESAERKI